MSSVKQDVLLAFLRTTSDFPDRAFAYRRTELELVKANLDEWADDLAFDICNNRFVPGKPEFCDVPKGGGAVRPGAVFQLRDLVYYSYLVGRCYPFIFRTHAEQKPPRMDTSNELASPDGPRFVVAGVKQWMNFRKRTLSRLKAGTQYIVQLDIAAYYDSIELELLDADLLDTGCPEDFVRLLIETLRAWSPTRTRGIPQGSGASDVLAKLYLKSVDELLRSNCVDHLRYVDDFHLFVDTENDAKRAIIFLSSALRSKGLLLQTSKLSTVPGRDAIRLLEEVPIVINRLKYKLAEPEVVGLIAGDYHDKQSIVQKRDIPIEAVNALREAYRSSFVDPATCVRPFSPTLFRYIVNRLADACDGYAIGHILDVIIKNEPQVTSTALKYLALSRNLWVEL